MVKVDETCLDDYLAPRKFTEENTEITSEHRIYVLEPEFFTREPDPQITTGLSFSPLGQSPGGTFSFEVDKRAYYELVLDLDQGPLDPPNGFDPYSLDGKDVIFTGIADGGELTEITWYGRARTGEYMPLGNYLDKARLWVYSGIANFPLKDFELGHLTLSKSDGANFQNLDVFWHDSIAAGGNPIYNNLDGGGEHSWPPGGGFGNYVTNCTADVVNIGPSELYKTLGDHDWVNTWVYDGLSEEIEDFALLEIVGVSSIVVDGAVNDSVQEGNPVTGTVNSTISDPSRKLEISLFDAVSGERISGPQIVPLDDTSVSFDFSAAGNLSPRNYRIDVEIDGAPCKPCSLSRRFSVIKAARSASVPELSVLFLPLIAFAVLAFVFLSKKAKK